MKILQMHTSMAGGGIQSIVCALCNEMVKTQDVTLCTIYAPQDGDIFDVKLRNEVKRHNLGKKKTGISVGSLFKVYTFIKKGKYDVVHIHGFFYYYIFAVFLLYRKVKFFYTIHSDAKFENTTWDNRLIKLKKFAFIKRMIHPITISQVSQESFLNYYGFGGNLIFNSIPRPSIEEVDLLKEFRVSHDTRLFVHPGRITEAKNQVVLCQAFKRLIDAGYDACLIIAGSRQDEQIYTEIEKYFCKRIIYVGEQENIPQILYNADAMCLSSIWEGLPVTLLEALSVGCIPICTPVGGIVNIIEHGRNGFLSEDTSADKYYEVLQKFMNISDDALNLMQQNCKSTFLSYDISKASSEHLKLYESI